MQNRSNELYQMLSNIILMFFEAEALPDHCLLRQICGLRIPPIKDELITLTEAAEILGVNKGTASRYADSGAIRDNGVKGQNRRVWKSSVLFFRQEREDERLRKDTRELRRDSKRIPNTH